MYILLKWRLEVYEYQPTQVVLFGIHFLCEQYFGRFSRFLPCGAWVHSVRVHLNSTMWWIAIACGLLGGFLMNSQIVIWRHLSWCGKVLRNVLILVCLGRFFWCLQNDLQTCPLDVAVSGQHTVSHILGKLWHTWGWSFCTTHSLSLGGFYLLLCFYFFLFCSGRGNISLL